MRNTSKKGRSDFTLLNHPLSEYHLKAYSIPDPYDWQMEVISEAATWGSRCAVSSANGAGKTNIIVPLLGLSVMDTFPGATVVSTAGVEEQIEGQLFMYLEAKLRRYKKTGWDVATSRLVVTGPVIDGLQSRWIARVPRDPLSLQGYHGHWETTTDGREVWCPVLLIIDEAHLVGLPTYESAWRIEPDWFLTISTPGNDYGPFYDSMEDIVKSGKSGAVYKDKHGLWTYRRRIADTECPHLQTKEKLDLKEALIKKFGANSSYIKSKYGGEFKRPTDENYVFKDYVIELVRKAMGENVKTISGEKLASLDFSGGGDEQVYGMVDGNEVKMESFREEDTAKLAAIFVEKLEKDKVLPHNVNADNGGLGLAVIDNMESMDYRGINRYMNNQNSISSGEYSDRITEDHYRFIEFLQKYPIKLPNDPILLKQIRQRRFVLDDHRKVKLELKKMHRSRTGESPDRLDALIMLFANWSMPRSVEKVEPEYRSKLLAAAQERSGTGGGSFGWMKDYKQTNLANTVIHEMAKMRK